MDQEAAKLATAIGARVKQERQARGWTLDQLACAASVSRRMVVSVEHGAVNPSVGTLLRLSDALGVGLPALVEPPETKSVKVTRSGEGAALWSGAAGGRGLFVGGPTPPRVGGRRAGVAFWWPARLLPMWSSCGTGRWDRAIATPAKLMPQAPRNWCTCWMALSPSRSKIRCSHSKPGMPSPFPATSSTPTPIPTGGLRGSH